MRVYSISLINHLGERFRTTKVECDDDEAALALGRRFESQGYPVEVHISGRRVSLSALPPWKPDCWLKHLL